MNIKEKIGHRISIERKAKKLTQAELAQLAGGYRQSRLNNWEKGIRTPGIEEVKQLAEILEVSPSYIMCLTDQKSGPDNIRNEALIPLLNYKQACRPMDYLSGKDEGSDIPLITFSIETGNSIDGKAFAIKMNDESMEPELKINDLLIIDTKREPRPGNFVIAKLENEILVRRFRLLSMSSMSSNFELLALNTHWPNIQNNENLKCEILGTVISLNRKML